MVQGSVIIHGGATEHLRRGPFCRPAVGGHFTAGSSELSRRPAAASQLSRQAQLSPP